MLHSCPVCTTPAPEAFYTVRQLPVACSFVFANTANARAVPRGDIELCECGTCGLIFNRAFDPVNIDYASGYEESQGYSGTFSKFEEGLCRDLKKRFDLQDKTILEVGCGKGAFLMKLCNTARANGLGFDPAFDPDRITAQPRVQFRRENFTSEHSAITADLVCCKMTLEHVTNTTELLRAMRDSATGAVFIQVPAAERIFNETAFWDIYYEHCQYFTKQSLAAALSYAGLQVDNIDDTFDGQYLLAYAHPGVPIAKDPQPGSGLVAGFEERIPSALHHWRDRIQRAATEGPVVLWGGGSKAVSFVESLDIAHWIRCVVDINPYKQDTFLPGSGLPVVAPQALLQDPPYAVFIMNPVYRTEITATLLQLHLAPKIIPVA